MIEARGKGTIRWHWLETLSPPELVKVVNCTHDDMPLFQFYQCTVRLHSKQVTTASIFFINIVYLLVRLC